MKASWHGAILAFVAGAAVYNAAACLKRPCWRLALGTALYSGLTYVEYCMVRRHLESR